MVRGQHSLVNRILRIIHSMVVSIRFRISHVYYACISFCIRYKYYPSLTRCQCCVGVVVGLRISTIFGKYIFLSTHTYIDYDVYKTQAREKHSVCFAQWILKSKTVSHMDGNICKSIYSFFKYLYKTVVAVNVVMVAINTFNAVVKSSIFLYQK